MFYLEKIDEPGILLVEVKSQTLRTTLMEPGGMLHLGECNLLVFREGEVTRQNVREELHKHQFRASRLNRQREGAFHELYSLLLNYREFPIKVIHIAAS